MLGRASPLARLRSLPPLHPVGVRCASAEYAHLAVKKNNWVEQNEVLRENRYASFTIDRSNLGAIVFMCVLFPLGYRALFMSEMEQRDVLAGGPVRPRV